MCVVSERCDWLFRDVMGHLEVGTVCRRRKRAKAELLWQDYCPPAEFSGSMRIWFHNNVSTIIVNANVH
jgi:hypothetical protein